MSTYFIAILTFLIIIIPIVLYLNTETKEPEKIQISQQHEKPKNIKVHNCKTQNFNHFPRNFTDEQRQRLQKFCNIIKEKEIDIGQPFTAKEIGYTGSTMISYVNRGIVAVSKRTGQSCLYQLVLPIEKICEMVENKKKIVTNAGKMSFIM